MLTAGDGDEGTLPSWGRSGFLVPPWKGLGLCGLSCWIWQTVGSNMGPWLWFGLVMVFLLVSLGPRGGMRWGRGGAREGRGGREGYSSVES